MDPDLPLIRALQAGDDSALDELIRRHQAPLLHFVYRYLRNEAAARDVVQETFVRTYFKAPKFEPRAAVKTWMYAIAVNLCRDEARRMMRRRSEVSVDEPVRSEAPPPLLADPNPSPDEMAGRHDQFSALQAAIEELPRPLREALVLFALDERSQKEAADILGTTPKTVELRVYHAKARLRRMLRGVLGKPPGDSEGS
ncbi:MAG TPA: sigma-70 family RNA polymerase sigma factor [Candidatus Didemnitutus sp.]|nr:sigma-70 family RNA polymerase sigma factor [Candidatus Didemnitutus sp.]